jgi:ABC-2 type transport system ATP-binding protein
MGAGLAIDALDFGYRSSRPVLAGVSWVPGQRTALLGPNGAGKSTLFGVSCGALRPRRGTVEIGGAPVRPGQVGWMPQTISALPSLRCQEQVALAGWLQGLGRSQAWEAAARALDAVDLRSQAHDRSASLSGGQVRRLGVAEFVVAEPDDGLIDEPTVGH